ncbi:MAG: FkbM family methyltransferase [Paracoccaceae bacterium]
MKAQISRAKKALRKIVMGGKRKASSSFFDETHKFLIGKRSSSSLVVFDVGAHYGESIRRFRQMFPDCQVHSFEPSRKSYAVLRGAYSNQESVFLNNSGVSSSPGNLAFHSNAKSNTSSFVPIDSSSKWVKKRASRLNLDPKEFTQEIYQVPVTTLDIYANERKIQNIDILKIDTQGHEEEVLDGASGLLNEGKIKIIETEIILGSAYEKKLNFRDLESRLLDQSYFFYGIDNFGDLMRTPWLSANLLYVHESLLSENLI